MTPGECREYNRGIRRGRADGRREAFMLVATYAAAIAIEFLAWRWIIRIIRGVM